MTSCDGGDLYNVNSPDWIQAQIDSIAALKGTGETELPEGTEDVYTIGKTDFSSGWWAEFSKYYVIPNGKEWNGVFNLNINPSAPNTYKNFALIITNDADRGGDGYTEYGAIRFDNQPSGNSEWGDFIDRSCVESTLTFGTDTDEGVQKLGGRVILTIDRTDPNAFTVKMTNGVVTKTYKQKSPLANLNADASNENIRAFLVPEGSYINFIQSNIEPIGGFTSAEDKQPLTIKLNGVPDEVLLGTSLEDAIAGISAAVMFEELPDAQIIPNEKLIINVDGNIEEEGEKTLVVIYNKTFKGENCAKPIYALAKFKVVKELSAFTSKYVCPTPAAIGATDNTSAFWAEHTGNVKVEPRQTVVSTFTNYSSCANNWSNFCIVLCKEDNAEYAVVRADNFGWGDGYAACQHSNNITSDEEWNEWRDAMNGAKVTTYITNNGDGTASIKAIMVGTNGKTYVQEYNGINTVDKDNFYCRYTIEASHLVFDTVFGNTDNSTPFWGAHTANIQIPAHTVFTTSFINYSTGVENWNNYCVVLCKDDATEYAVVRADNFGWGDGYAACQHSNTITSDEEWGAWRSAMNGATVDLTITNNGNGTADISAVAHGTNGVDYYQTYTGINTIDADNFYFNLTVDNSHIEFSPKVTQAKRSILQVNKHSKRIRR